MKIIRVGVFYDGNYFFHVSNYYNYEHPTRRRISIQGLHRFIRAYIADKEEVGVEYCRIIDAHYFRGRLSSYEADQANRLLAERAFEDILLSEGVITHYLPLRSFEGRKEEKGIDIWLALEAYEMAIHKDFDVVVLIACDGDYVPLVKKLNTLGIRVAILGWEFEYTDSRNGKTRSTVTSIDLLNEATYPVPMHELIDNRHNDTRFNLDQLFVPKETPKSVPKKVIGGPKVREESHILSMKDGYGFIAKPPHNLFFHWTDVVDIDFNDLHPGDTVAYTIGLNERGKEVAVEVELLEEE